LQAIGDVVALVALLYGIALSPELLGRLGWHSKNSDPVSVLSICTSWSLARLPYPAAPGEIGLHPTATPLFGWHPTAHLAGTLVPITIAGTSNTEGRSSPGDSSRPPPAPATHSTVANYALGYAVS